MIIDVVLMWSLIYTYSNQKICIGSNSILILSISIKKTIRINMWMNPAKEMDQFRKTEKFIEHECCKWNKQIKVFKALKVNYKFTQGRAKHLVYVLVVLILFIISLVCINSYHGCTKTVYLNRVFFNWRKKNPSQKQRPRMAPTRTCLWYPPCYFCNGCILWMVGS